MCVLLSLRASSALFGTFYLFLRPIFCIICTFLKHLFIKPMVLQKQQKVTAFGDPVFIPQKHILRYCFAAETQHYLATIYLDFNYRTPFRKLFPRNASCFIVLLSKHSFICLHSIWIFKYINLFKWCIFIIIFFRPTSNFPIHLP